MTKQVRFYLPNIIIVLNVHRDAEDQLHAAFVPGVSYAINLSSFSQ